MKYALNIAEDGRILSATFAKYAPSDAVQVDTLPEGNVSDYLYLNGKYIHDPLPEPDPEPVDEQPTQLDIIEAQVTYTAMMTDTLLESEE